MSIYYFVQWIFSLMKLKSVALFLKMYFWKRHHFQYNIRQMIGHQNKLYSRMVKVCRQKKFHFVVVLLLAQRWFIFWQVDAGEYPYKDKKDSTDGLFAFMGGK